MTPQQPDRRNFIKKASLGSFLSLSLTEIVLSSFTEEKVSKIMLKKDDIILFQGDSITDSGRLKTETGANQSRLLGNGYPFMASSDLLMQHPTKNLKIYNKGISGNKVYQLAERWDTDCLELKPNVLSIMIGVNDFWHTLTSNYTGTSDTYRKDYKALLERTKQSLPDVKLIIGEPFAVTGVKAVTEKWYPAFNEYRQAAKEMAASYNAAWIPYQTVFDNAQKLAPGSYWTTDGVHPTLAGARLMATAWLETVKG